MAAITLDIGGNTRRLDRDIQKTVNRVYSINLKTKGDQPLGRITGQVNEFTKSLDASNARVIAFGASAGIIFGVQRAFAALVSSTIEVQKSLQDINVILNVSAQNLQKFGSELFNIAKNTGQSFQAVATAATEFSRQGLGVEETLKRTNEALILSRLSGLDTAKSVEALTAAVNSFANQAVTATEVVNKFANVDAAFAVSSADLAEALQRVGSSASQSGVSLNELIAIVTAAQQTTARGGAVIGNSFKTIFTRLQRGKVVNLLGSLGISDTDDSGQLKSTIQLLQDLGKVYDTLGARQQAAVAEQVGGVFQINILKAALADLGKEYSIYSSALNVAAGTTDEAIKRNEELNKTYAAQINALKENARELAAAGGERLLGPSIDRLVGGTNQLLGGFSESDGQSVGVVLGKGILDGLGTFIAGPGLALIGGVLLKLFRDLGKFATGSVQQLLGLNTAATQQRDLQASIQQILSKNPQLLELALKSEQGLNTAANSLLASLQKQTVELQKQAQVAQQISKAFIAQAGVRVAGGVPVVPAGKTPKPGKAGGYIPNFSAEVFNARELGASKNVRETKNIGTIGGKPFQPNNEEIQIPNMFGTGDTGVIPKYGNGIKEATKMIANGESGSILDKSNRNRAKGFIPNFAYPYKIKTFAGEGVKNPRAEKQFNKFFNKGGFSNVEIDDKINTVGFKIQQIPLTQRLQELYNTQPGSPVFTKEFEDYAIKKLGFINAGKTKSGSVKLYGGSSSAVDGYRIKNGLAEFLEVKGGGFETLSVANKFGRVLPENLGRFTQSQLGIQYLNMLFKEGVPDKKDIVQLKNTLAVPKVPKARKGNFNRPFRVRDIEANRAKNIGRAQGFIPNFAQTKNSPIELGNLDKIPNKLGKKVLSLIYPGLSTGYTLRPATARYLNQQYTGNVPVAGINEKTLKSQLPDLDKNIGNLLVREANQFGQALGGFNFLKSPNELPNYGAAKSAVGVAFEGGVGTLLQQKVGKQNAGIDFRNITPRLRSIFNNAPGVYDAKRSPNLTNEVLQKLLNETKPGATVQKSSGKAGAAYLKERSAAVEQLRKEGVTGSVAIRQALKNRFGIVGKAAGFIPNFAAIQDAVNREQDAGIPKNKIYLAQEGALKKANSAGLGVFNKLQEPNKKTRKDAMRRKGFAKGYVPNFAIEDPDVQGARAETATAAIISQITGIAFAFAFTGNQFKESLKQLTEANQQAGKVQREISAKQKRDFFDEEKRLRGRVGAEGRANERAQQAQFAPGGLQKTSAFLRSNALGLSIAAPILGETLKNIAGQETPGARQFGEVASGAGQIASFGATGALIAKGGGPIGLAIGALLTIPNVVNAFTTELPELTAAAKKASQDLTKFSDASQRILTASSSLSEFTDKGASPEKLKKVQDDLAKALSELTPAERSRIESSIRLGGLEEELAKITQERIEQEQLRAKAVSVRAIAEKGFTRFSKTFDPTTAEGKSDEETIRSVFKGFFTGKTPEETLENFNKAARSGVPQLQNLIQSVAELDRDLKAGTAGRRNLYGTFEGPDFTQIFTNILEESIPQGKTADQQESRSRFIKDLVDIADNDITNFQNILQIPLKTLTRDAEELAKGIDSAKESTKNAIIFNKVKEKYSGIIENSISSLNRTISVFNSLANALDQFQVSAQSFEREQSVSQGFTLPKNVAETVLGPEAELTRRAALFEKIAQNETARLDAIDKANLGFREDFRGNLNEVFTGRLNEIQTLKASEARTIPEQAALAEEILKAQKLFESGAVNINDILEDSFKDGVIDSDKFSADLRAAFEKADFKSSEVEKILDGILKVSEQQNANLLSINQNAKQQNVRAAQEFANEKILLDISRSLKVFGGIQSFLQPSEEGIIKPLQTLIQSATGQLKAQRGFEFGKKTGSLTGFGTEKQVQNNIALGQSALNFINQLKDISGGAFAPDPSSELYNRAVAGLTQSFESNIKKLNDILKDPKVDQAFKSQIKATLDAIGGLGSGREIAQLQIAKETGSAFQSTLEGTLSRLQDPAIQQLRDANLPDLANEIARSSQYTANPIVNALNVQKSIQTNITKQLEDIKKLLPKSNKGPSIAVQPSQGDVQTNAKGFIPAFNKERQAISRGVGGAKAGDRPQFIPNLNGSPAFVNSGESLVDNYGGSGQTAVLTREMQKGMAKGFIPNFDDMKKIPRPWELTPGTSMGYQMLMGDGKDSMKERLRKGLAQFIGRYATNMHEPLSYGVPKFLEKWTENSSSNKSIIEKLSESFSEVPFKKILKDEPNYRVYDEFDRDTLYREMFDLPSRFGTKELKKIDKKQYQLSDYKNVNPKDPVNFHPLLGGVYLQKTPDGKSKFNDKWNIVSSSEEGVENPDFSLRLRKMVDKILRPAYVSGTIPPPKNMAGGFIPNFAAGEPIITADSFGPISGRVIQDLTDTGKDYIVIRSDKPLDNSFDKQTISFGEGKGVGKIISLDSKDPYKARVQLTKAQGILPPVKDYKFDGKILSRQEKQKQDLSAEELQKKLDKYTQQYEEAFRFTISGNGEGTFGDSAEILRNLQREFQFNSQNYNNIDDNSTYRRIKQSTQELRDKIRSTNPIIPERSQDPEFLKFLEEQKNKPTGIGPSVTPAIQNQIAETISGSATSDAIIKPENITPQDLLKDATLRAALLNERVGRTFGINTGTTGPTDLTVNRKKPNSTGLTAEAYPGAKPGSSIIDYYGIPNIGTLFNEATHFLQFGTSREERGLKVKKYADKYIGNLKKLADFIEQQNKDQPFVSINRYNGKTPFGDNRIFDRTISEFGSNVSEFDYIEERASTLQDALFRGISTGSISAKELEEYGITPEVANFIVAETKALEKQLKTQTYQQKPDRPELKPKSVTQPSAVPGIPTTQTIIPPPKVEDLPTKPKPKPKPVAPPPAVPGIPTAVPEPKPAIPKAATGYPGGISDATARAIVQELDATYNEAIRQQRNPQIAKAWAQTQQRYRLLYSQSKYAELDAFYKGLKKDYQKPIGQNPNKFQNQTNFAQGFIPNFAKDYISNLAGLEAGLSGEDPAMGYDKKIGSFMYNKAQSRSGNLNEIIAKDHPEGLKAAMKNSMKMQKSVGVMNKGFVPNFAVTDQSFTQLESSFSANTSALTSLAGGIESLNSTLSNFEANFANLNNGPGTQPAGAQAQAGAQPNVTTTTNAPVNVVVNAQGGNDIAAAVGEAVQNAIPTIIDKVKVALGQKVPPKTS
jgi:TP901 family phage tail tape measure protein